MREPRSFGWGAESEGWFCVCDVLVFPNVIEEDRHLTNPFRVDSVTDLLGGLQMRECAR